MRRKRTKLAPGRLAAVIVCALLAAAVLWGALGLVAKLTHYGESSTIVSGGPGEEETPGQAQLQPSDAPEDGLIPGLAVNSYDASKFYQQDGLIRYSGDTPAHVGEIGRAHV